MPISKYVLPVVAGIMAGAMLINQGENLVIRFYPLPTGINQHDKDAIANALKQMPLSAFLFLLVNYAICSMVAGIITTLLAKRTTLTPALIVGIALTLGGLFNVISIKHPMWFSILNLFIYLPFVYFGYLSVRIKELD